MGKIGKSVYKVLTPIVATIDKTVNVDSIVDNGDDTYTLNTCDTGYATVGFTITIDAVYYKIESIVWNESITISGASLPDTALITLYDPKFYHGTVIVTNAELLQKALSWEKFPLIWLHEIANEDVDLTDLEMTSKTCSCELYLMIDANHNEWTNNQQYELAIGPMRNLTDRLIDALLKHKNVNGGEMKRATITDRPKWGVYIGEKGNVQRIFADNLSGVKMEIDIPFINTCEC